MISSQMDNPFAIGDLVHISQGVVLYGNSDNFYLGMSNSPLIPTKVNDKPTVGLVMENSIHEFYNIAVGQERYYVRKEDMALVSRKAMR